MPTYVMRAGKLIDKRLVESRANRRAPHLLSDIAPFVTQDGTAITSRMSLRAYERRYGVRQVGNDWTGPRRPPFWDRYETGNKAR